MEKFNLEQAIKDIDITEPKERGITMDYEQKYKEALNRIKEALAPVNGCEISGLTRSCIEEIFPELRESEDERIRKEILNVVKQLDEGTTICGKNYDYNKWIAWLEKQGEQKPIEYDVPNTPIKDSGEVTSRMKYIDENLKPIAKFIIGYSMWDLRKDEWNHPVATVPLFRVLDALVQNGKQYTDNQN